MSDDLGVERLVEIQHLAGGSERRIYVRYFRQQDSEARWETTRAAVGAPAPASHQQEKS